MHEIQKLKHQWFVVAVLIVWGGWPSLAIAAEDKHSPKPTRHIELDGQSNFRDIGGYKTVDGRTVKWGIIYRSGELPNLTDDDLAKLEQLKIRSVVNFLTEKEIKYHGADRVPKGVQQYRAPIETDVGDLAATIVQARKTSDFSKVPPDLNPQIHRLLVQGKTSRKEYAALLRRIADVENHPLVFHCSHGVHRTGTATAILLSALGVPWEVVRKDYLLSNICRKDEIEQRLDYFRQEVAKRENIAPAKVDMTNFEAFYVLQGKYIDASRDEILKTYGSFDQYFTTGLGLTHEELKRLKDALLE